MDDDAVRELVRDVEIAKARVSEHEAVCAERYRLIAQRQETHEVTLTEVKKSMQAISEKIGANETGNQKLIRGFLVAIILLLMGLAGWMAGQLYQLEPARSGQVAGAAKTR